MLSFLVDAVAGIVVDTDPDALGPHVGHVGPDRPRCRHPLVSKPPGPSCGRVGGRPPPRSSWSPAPERPSPPARSASPPIARQRGRSAETHAEHRVRPRSSAGRPRRGTSPRWPASNRSTPRTARSRWRSPPAPQSGRDLAGHDGRPPGQGHGRGPGVGPRFETPCVVTELDLRYLAQARVGPVRFEVPATRHRSRFAGRWSSSTPRRSGSQHSSTRGRLPCPARPSVRSGCSARARRGVRGEDPVPRSPHRDQPRRAGPAAHSWLRRGGARLRHDSVACTSGNGPIFPSTTSRSRTSSPTSSSTRTPPSTVRADPSHSKDSTSARSTVLTAPR